MRKLSLHTLLLCILGVGCSSLEESVPVPNPAPMPPKPVSTMLTVTAPKKGVLGEEFDLNFVVEQPLGSKSCTIAVKLLSGRATATLDDAVVPLEGEWISLSDSASHLVVKPQLTGTLMLSLQAKSAAGITSEVKIVDVTIIASAAQPILRLTAPSQGSKGLPLDIDLEVESTAEGACSLAAVLISGTATAVLNDAALPLDGAWMTLSDRTCRMVVTPTAAGMLKLSLRGMSPEGVQSTAQIVTIPIAESSPISAEASCQKTITNPSAGARIPVTLKITKPGYSGTFLVSTAQLQGKGRFFSGKTEITDTTFEMGTSGTVDYLPEILGDHAFEFSIAAQGVETTTPAYVGIVKQITVACIVSDCFTIIGPGEYHTQGEQVVLKIADEGYLGAEAKEYGFEVEGWYENGGPLLTSQPTYTTTLSLDSPTAFLLKLKKRVVTITRNNPYKKPFTYPLPSGEWVTVYDYRTEFKANKSCSDKMQFYYQEYRYKTIVPPVPETRMASPSFLKRNSESNLFWRIDNDFHISIRRTDNPELNFNEVGHYVESSSTKYILPSDVAFQ